MWLLLLLIFVLSTCSKGEEVTTILPTEDPLATCLNECGLDSSFFEDEKSFGGWPATSPFAGQLEISIPGCNNFISHCTAFIVGEQYIMSAKHCIDVYFLLGSYCPDVGVSKYYPSFDEEGNLLPSTIKFIAQSNLTEINPDDTYKIKNVHYITREGFYLDIILLELKSPIKFTLNKRAACLYSSYVPAFAEQLHFIGFGKIYTDEAAVSRWPVEGDKLVSTKFLHRVLLSVQSATMCRKAAKSQFNHVICVGSKGVGLTAGDSGGPAFVRHHGRFFAVGVASQAGMKNEALFDTFTGRQIRPDRLIKITPDICRQINELSKNKVSCMNALTGATKKCVDRITEALEAQVPDDFSFAKIDDPKISQNQTENEFVLHTDNGNLKRFGNLIDSKNATICDILQKKQCIKFGYCLIHCETEDGRCESPEINDKRISFVQLFTSNNSVYFDISNHAEKDINVMSSVNAKKQKNNQFLAIGNVTNGSACSNSIITFFKFQI